MSRVKTKSISAERLIAAWFAISLAAHIFLLYFAYRFPFSPAKGGDEPMDAVEVKIVSPENSENLLNKMGGQIVDLLDDMKSREAPKDTPYLSDRNRMVDQEMQAALTGPDPNAPFTSLGGGERSDIFTFEEPKDSQGDLDQHEDSSQSVIAMRNENILDKKGYSTELNLNPSAEDLSRHFAMAPSNYLPNVQIGNSTLLNTREFAYASFFIRMKRMMESVWDPRTILSRTAIERRSAYITSLNIVLNCDGSLESLNLIQSSGVAALDKEAIRTVRESSPYPNPPKELCEADGKIRIASWGFIVNIPRGFF